MRDVHGKLNNILGFFCFFIDLLVFFCYNSSNNSYIYMFYYFLFIELDFSFYK